MSEIPGAQEQLERDAVSLREQILELARELTPARLPEIVIRGFFIADWHEPFRYQHQVSDLLLGAVEGSAQEFLDRAAALMADQGWAIERGATPVPGSAPMIRVTGTRNGFQIIVRVQEGASGVLYAGETAPRPLYEPVAFVPPPRGKTVDPGLARPACQARGWCQVCPGLPENSLDALDW